MMEADPLPEGDGAAIHKHVRAIEFRLHEVVVGRNLVEVTDDGSKNIEQKPVRVYYKD
jgi:hypothetical protein